MGTQRIRQVGGGVTLGGFTLVVLYTLTVTIWFTTPAAIETSDGSRVWWTPVLMGRVEVADIGIWHGIV